MGIASRDIASLTWCRTTGAQFLSRFDTVNETLGDDHIGQVAEPMTRSAPVMMPRTPLDGGARSKSPIADG
jgi:hypothetical protein